MALKVESGLSVLSRLCSRPSISSSLGPGLPAPKQQVTQVRCSSDMGDTMDLLTSYVVELLCNITLPKMVGEVLIGGCGAGAVLLDCDHHVKVKMVALTLQSRVAKVAEQHLKEMKDRGHSRELREKQRITSSMQWEIVKGALERLLVMNVYTPDNLEISLLSLQNVLMDNTTISAVLINGINSFYHQVKGDTGISHSAYMKRLINLALTGCKDTSEDLKILYVEHNLFGDKNDFEKDEHSNSNVVIEKLETNFAVTFLGCKSQFSLNSSGVFMWGGSNC